MARSEAASLFSVNGHEYLDFLGELYTGIYGHSSAAIKEAIIEALGKGWNFGTKNTYEDQLAGLLVQRFSNSMELIRFCNSGTEANMMTVGAVINFTGKKKVRGLGVWTDELVKALPLNSLAAILVEPMQVAGGCIPGTREFLQYLRGLASTENALLIFDEIMTSQLDYGDLQVPLGIKPHVTTIGKCPGGGEGGRGARREIMVWFNPRTGKLGHSGTFNNNIVTMATGVTGCLIMTKEVQSGLNALGTKAMADTMALIRKRIVAPNDITTEPKIFVVGYGSLLCLRSDPMAPRMRRCGIYFTIISFATAFILPREGFWN